MVINPIVVNNSGGQVIAVPFLEGAYTGNGALSWSCDSRLFNSPLFCTFSGEHLFTPGETKIFVGGVDKGYANKTSVSLGSFSLNTGVVFKAEHPTTGLSTTVGFMTPSFYGNDYTGFYAEAKFGGVALNFITPRVTLVSEDWVDEISLVPGIGLWQFVANDALHSAERAFIIDISEG